MDCSCTGVQRTVADRVTLDSSRSSRMARSMDRKVRGSLPCTFWFIIFDAVFNRFYFIWMVSIRQLASNTRVSWKIKFRREQIHRITCHVNICRPFCLMIGKINMCMVLYQKCFSVFLSILFQPFQEVIMTLKWEYYLYGLELYRCQLVRNKVTYSTPVHSTISSISCSINNLINLQYLNQHSSLRRNS